MMAVSVKSNNNSSLEQKIRIFKTQVARSGNLSKAKEIAEGYKKPGVNRREEKKRNTINSRRNNKNRNRYN